MFKYAATVLARLLSSIMIAGLLTAFVVYVVWDESLQFILSDGWLGSLFGGAVWGGTLVIIGSLMRFVTWLFRPLPRTID